MDLLGTEQRKRKEKRNKLPCVVLHLRTVMAEESPVDTRAQPSPGIPDFFKNFDYQYFIHQWHQLSKQSL